MSERASKTEQQHKGSGFTATKNTMRNPHMPITHATLVDIIDDLFTLSKLFTDLSL